MSSKMKRCIDKLRRRQNAPEKGQAEGPAREELLPQVASESDRYDGANEGICDGVSESVLIAKKEEEEMKQLANEETDHKRETLRRIPTVQQKIQNEPAYWGPTRSIEEAGLAALLKRIINTADQPEFKLVDVLNGAFNVAYILKSTRGPKICVRVPACGFPERWNKTDADLLRATALGMKYIEFNSKLPIPQVLAYSTGMDNEISAPFTMMTFLEGKSVALLWHDYTVPRPVLEARRQRILQSLANIMCTLSTTTFHHAGTLWFPDEESHPEVGISYRLDKDNIFTINRTFLTYAPRNSVSELLREAREKRYVQDGYPERCSKGIIKGCYILWDVMIEAFLQSGGKIGAGEPEFVLMQSDFNPQNILADETGNVTGIIDWDCLESIPRQIGWCSLPHWLEADWSPEYHWPPDIDDVVNTAKPDEYDGYRQDYTGYMREACGGRSDSMFTSRSHIYQSLFDSVESFTKLECFVYNVLVDILPRTQANIHHHVGEIGKRGFRVGEKEWFEARLVRYFAPNPESVAPQ